MLEHHVGVYLAPFSTQLMALHLLNNKGNIPQAIYEKKKRAKLR
jgi:hypothetical protein